MKQSPGRRSSDTPSAAAADARKKWEQAAFRSGLFFILLPAFPVPLITALPLVSHSLGFTVAIVFGWMIVVICSVTYGCFRIRKYKRDHPFVA